MQQCYCWQYLPHDLLHLKYFHSNLFNMGINFFMLRILLIVTIIISHLVPGVAFANSYKANLPTTDKLYPRLLTLPLHPELSFEDIVFVVKSVKEGIDCVKTTSR